MYTTNEYIMLKAYKYRLYPKNKHHVSVRTYSCSCGFTEDRDIKAARCIEAEGLKELTKSKIREGLTEFTLVERKALAQRQF